MKKNMLWRYYGLYYLGLVTILIVVLLGAIARIYHIEWLYKWGVSGIGSLCGGLVCLLRGLDLVVFCRKYPPLLRENALKWDSRSRRTSPATLLFIGVWFTLGGSLMVYTGGWHLVNAVLELFSK